MVTTRCRSGLLALARVAHRLAATALCFAAVGPAGSASAQVIVGEPFVLEQDATYRGSAGVQRAPALTAGPGEYFAVFTDDRRGAEDLFGQRIRTDGTVVAPGSLQLVPDAGVFGAPAVAWNGSVYLVVWYDGATLWGARIDPAGQALGARFAIDQQQMRFWPAVASDGDGFLVTYATEANIVSAVRISGDGEVLDPAPLALSPVAASLGYPKVAWGAGFYMVTWAQAPGLAIMAGRVNSDGVVLDPSGLTVATGGEALDPQIDFDGENFFITWKRDGSLFGARVAPEGSAITPSGLLLDSSWGAITNMQLAWNGSRHLLTITKAISLVDRDTYALLIDAAGRPLGAPIAVATIPGLWEAAFGAAAVGTQCFVLCHKVWSESVWPALYEDDGVEGARVDAAGTVLDPQQFGIHVSTEASRQGRTAVAFDGTNFMALFTDRRDPWTFRGLFAPYNHVNGDLYAVRVSPEGVPLDTEAMHIAGGPVTFQEEPQLIFAGGQYAAVYLNQGESNEDQIRLTRFLPDGTVLDPEGILVYDNIGTGYRYLDRPVVASSDDAYCVVWEDRYLTSGEEDIQFAIIGHDGAMRAGPGGLPSDGGRSAQVASDGESFLVTWYDAASATSAHISATGVVTGPRVISSRGASPRIAWNGETYLAVWPAWTATSDKALRARPIGADGVPAGPTVTIAEAASSSTFCQALYADGDDFVLVKIPYEFYRLDATGAPLGPPQTFSMPAPVESPTGIPAWAAGPDDTFMAVMSSWAGGPYNSDRAWGRIVTLDQSCSADCDESGSLDFFDFLCFQNQFGAADPRADCDDSGGLDFFDFLCFQNTFAAGCP